MNPVLYAHPVAMAATFLLALYVLFLGLVRVCSLHFKLTVKFLRERHALLGELLMLCWVMGGVGGFLITRSHRSILPVDATWLHFQTATVCMPLLLVFGLLSGLYMDSRKRPRVLLPMLHGLNNFLLLGLAAWQGWTGGHILLDVMLPGSM